MIYTALDLAGSTGVCWGEPFTMPQFDTWKLDGRSNGARGLDLMRRLTKHLREVRPDKVFIEKPLEPVALFKLGDPGATALLLNGYAFMAQTVCYANEIPTQLYDRQDVLQHFTGQGRYKEKNGGKKACVVRCKQLWRVDLEWDAADAGALWDYGCALENPKGYAMAGIKRPAQWR